MAQTPAESPHHFRGSTVGANAEAIESISQRFGSQMQSQHRSRRNGSADVISDEVDLGNDDIREGH